MMFTGTFKNAALALNLKILLGALLVFITYGSFAAQESDIKIQTLSEVALYPERSAPASVVSLNQATVSAQINASIVDIPVRVGDVVEKGDILARLECADYQFASKIVKARLEELDAQIQLAQRRVKRASSLLQKQSISEQTLEEREAELAVLMANLRAAQADLGVTELDESRCIVRSPYRALVQERMSAQGDYASVGHPLVNIRDLEDIEVSAQVFAQDARYVSIADRLYFDQAGQRYSLKLRTVLPVINIQTRNQEVRLSFDGVSALPGAAGKLVWRDVRPHVPAHLLVKRDGQLGLFIVSEGQARFVAMPAAQAGRASPVSLPVLTPLVVEGHLGLRDAEMIPGEGGS